MIVINYRRSDIGGYALYLRTELARTFGNARVFIDVSGELSGSGDFTKAIYERIERCQLLICLIGPHWLTASDATGRRLNNPDDLVRREIDLALQRNKAVLPVLVNGAEMPDRSALPACISDLVKNDAAFFRHERYIADTVDLINAVRRSLALRRQSSVPIQPTMYARESSESLPQLNAALAIATQYSNLRPELLSSAYTESQNVTAPDLTGPFRFSDEGKMPSLWDSISSERKR